MPAHTSERTMRDVLAPLAAVALIAQAHPALAAPGVEIGTIYADGEDRGLGVRLHLHEPADRVYERWANIIGSDNPDSHTRLIDSQPAHRKTFGAFAVTPIELIGYPPAREKA
ncbi:hypothetical protein OHS70_34355 [Streptomyces sp. NBC_00390]|uniref:hypothetical protein n=1 Tax=Streptomyces sp. NBC_00390 TaxID=2975736 RepID=UPI002E2220B5